MIGDKDHRQTALKLAAGISSIALDTLTETIGDFTDDVPESRVILATERLEDRIASYLIRNAP